MRKIHFLTGKKSVSEFHHKSYEAQISFAIKCGGIRHFRLVFLFTPYFFNNTFLSKHCQGLGASLCHILLLLGEKTAASSAILTNSLRIWLLNKH